MRTAVVNTRINSSLKDELEILSHLNGKTVSENVRQAIEAYLSDEVSEYNTVDKKQNKYLDVLQSLSFTELIFWVYDKKRNPAIEEIDELYYAFLDLIREINENPLFTVEILAEFDKVSRELKKLLYEDGYFENFTFPLDFSYEKLSYFMHGLRYDELNQKVIHIK
ncbi:hypothetical protein [Aestuariibaculum suncheonense]|uniref:Uncharacterized protein n=1 Tax=Aestuariibaculum suncheonense TaxID=1028745 RepID=A0A8J6QXY5_9FLAO|nr:hypothetical protein [Aestuariibaculum suncheonense]MBD0836529.1 hypothetical protein [Aestuariibaculum suncheonense]